MTRRLGLLLALAGVMPAQQKPPDVEPPPEEALVRVGVDLVNIFFSVRDKRGGYASSLTKADFTVLEDGRQQDVRFFTHETNLPLTIGLLVDVSRSQENLIGVEREASLRFFQQVLRPKDMAFVISFGAETELLQDFTNSLTLLRRALDGLRINAGSPGGGLANPGPFPVPGGQRGTALYEAVYLAATDRLRGETGRKAIVVITDGNDEGSRIKLEKAVEEAQRSDAILYSVLYEDPRYTSAFYGRRSGEGPMRKMAEETGGRMFRVDRRNTLDDIYRQIQEEMRSQYTVGYTTSNTARDGGFRRVEIRTRDKELKVQARKGYYASKN